MIRKLKTIGEHKESNWEKRYIFLVWHDIGVRYHGVKDVQWRSVTDHNLQK